MTALPPVRDQALSRLRRRRALWLRVHRWLGLSLGAVLAVVGATGSIMVFYLEIDEALNPGVVGGLPGRGGEGSWRPLGEALSAARAAVPADCAAMGIRLPRQDGAALAFYCSSGEGREATLYTVFVDPRQARVTGVRPAPERELLPGSFVDFVAYLHYSLLLKGRGYALVGILALLLLFSLPTGLILWWPITGKWRTAFTLEAGAGRPRLWHDLHKLAGLATLPVLGALLVSGVYMDLPAQSLEAIRLVSPGTRSAEGPGARWPEGAAAMGADEAVALARARYPGGRLAWLGLPGPEGGTYAVRRVEVPGPSRFWSERTVHVDPHRGAIVEVRDATARRTAGETFVDWLWPLHSGKAFGWPGRIAVLLAGLACPLLFATGLARWLRRHRAASLHPGLPAWGARRGVAGGPAGSGAGRSA